MSVDTPVGLIWNIAGYALMAHLLAHCLDMEAVELIFQGGDCHIYLDQLELMKEQIERKPFAAPTIRITDETKDLFQIKAEDIVIEGYESHPSIKYPVAV